MSAEHTPTPSEEPKQPQLEDPRTYVSFQRRKGQVEYRNTLMDEPLRAEFPPTIDPTIQKMFFRMRTYRPDITIHESIGEQTSHLIVPLPHNRKLLQRQYLAYTESICSTPFKDFSREMAQKFCFIVCYEELRGYKGVNFDTARDRAEYTLGAKFNSSDFSFVFRHFERLASLPDRMTLNPNAEVYLRQKLTNYLLRINALPPEELGKRHEPYSVQIINDLLTHDTIHKTAIHDRLTGTWSEEFPFNEEWFDQAWALISEYNTRNS